MDVNTAFVNSDLDRDNVFFNLPDGYTVLDDDGVAVSKLSQFLENPGPKHWEAAIHCLLYLKGTPDLGVTYSKQSPEWANRLTMFVDATWADCHDTRRSTTGFVGMLNGGPVCWRSQKQPIVAVPHLQVGRAPGAHSGGPAPPATSYLVVR